MTDLLRCPEISYKPEQAIGTCRLNGKPCFKETHPDAPCGYFDGWLKDCQAEFDKERPDVARNVDLWYNKDVMEKVCEIQYAGDLVPATLRQGKGSMFRSPQYRAFRETITWLYKSVYTGECRNDRLYRVDINMRQNIFKARGRNQRGDIDNMTKPILDSATGIIWHDDKQITELHIILNREVEESGCIVTIYDVGHWHNYRQQIPCLNCGQLFEVLISRFKRGDATFCSRQCHYDYSHRSHSCLQCGKEFTKVRSAKRGIKFCSSECYWGYMREHPDEYPNMSNNLKKATLTPKERNPKGQFKRKSHAIFQPLLQKLLKRCGGLCEECGQPPDWRGLAPHHIKFRSHGRDDSEDNLKMLCGRCHSKMHGIKEVESQPLWT